MFHLKKSFNKNSDDSLKIQQSSIKIDKNFFSHMFQKKNQIKKYFENNWNYDALSKFGYPKH